MSAPTASDLCHELSLPYLRLFWGHDGSSKPNLSLSGYANMAALMASLSDSAAGDDLDGILALDQVCLYVTN